MNLYTSFKALKTECLKTCALAVASGVEPAQTIDEVPDGNHITDGTAMTVVNEDLHNRHQHINNYNHNNHRQSIDKDDQQVDQQSSPKSQSSVKTQQVILSSRHSSASSDPLGPPLGIDFKGAVSSPPPVPPRPRA